MGFATLVESLGDGLYMATVDRGKALRDQRVEGIDTRLADLAPQLAEADAALDAAEADRDQVLVDLDAAIAAFRAAVESAPPGSAMPEEYQGLVDASLAMAEATRAVQAAQLAVTQLEVEMAALEADKARLENLEVEQQRELWCADYTDDAPAEKIVETIEVPGEPQQIIIAPQAPDYTEAKGYLLMRELMVPHQAFFNAAILPGWQRWRPNYRIGVVIAVRDDNTLNVELEGISSAQGLGINPPEPVGDAPLGELHGVPVDYMGAGADIFVVGDRVVVRINGFDWGDCTVIGFETKPRPVAGLLCYAGGSAKHRARPAITEDRVLWSASAAASVGDIDVNFGRFGWTDGVRAISWSSTIATAGDGIFYKGHRLMWWADNADNFGLYSGDDESVSVVAAWTTGQRVFAVLLLDNFIEPFLPSVEAICFDVMLVDDVLVGANAAVIGSVTLDDDDFEVGASQSPNGRSVLFFSRKKITRFDFSLTDADVSISQSNQVAGNRTSTLDFEQTTRSGSSSSPSYITSIDYLANESGSASWVVSAIWAAGEPGELEAWQPVVQTRTYESTFSLSLSGSESGFYTYAWSGSASGSELAQLHYPWGSYTLTDAASSWSGSQSGSIPDGHPLWLEDYLDNRVYSDPYNYPVALCRDVLLLVGRDGVYTLTDQTGAVDTGPTNITTSSSFSPVGPPSDDFIFPFQSRPVSISTSVTGFVRPIEVPRETQGVRLNKTGDAAAVKNAVFLCVNDQAGGFINYMTGNPTLADVFPDGVNPSGRFYPIVPY